MPDAEPDANPDAEPDVEIRLPDGAAEDPESELRSLLRWVHADESLERTVRGRLAGSAEPQPGHMGTAFDLLQFAVGSSMSGGALAVSILQWRDARRQRPALTIRHGGTEVDIPAEAAGDERLLRRITALLDEDSGDEGSGGDDQPS